ncbi:MAG: hypothetical protein U5O69_00380 [Candidatus Competibacteraceae bacterium]|nr:hypothetical protein [Candidatus Competibacteraceae bacterium]
MVLGGYENLLRELSELRQRDIGPDDVWKQLATAQKQLATTRSALQQKELLLKKTTADLQSLKRLFETLHHDTQLAFESLTWRVGFAIAETGRRLGLLQRTFMVQDHVAQIARNYQSWRRRRFPNGELDGDNFDEDAYLAQYPDVRAAIERGEFHSGREHFEALGRDEIASGARLYTRIFLSGRVLVPKALIRNRPVARSLAGRGGR